MCCGNVAHFHFRTQSIRVTESFSATVHDKNVVSLWAEIIRLCTIGVMLNVNPEKRQSDAATSLLRRTSQRSI